MISLRNAFFSFNWSYFHKQIWSCTAHVDIALSVLSGTAYEALRFGVEMPEGTEMTTQERGYTSPIWYTPAQ